jgi:hypothetical protein
MMYCPQAALHRGLGELAAAIEVLRQYLDNFSDDREAWKELADCYLEVCACCFAWVVVCWLRGKGDIGAGAGGECRCWLGNLFSALQKRCTA